MEAIWRVIIGFIFAFILHELTHLLVLIYYKIPIKSIVITKWTSFGFLVDNEKYVNDRKKLFLLHFLPLFWCLVIIIDPSEIYLLMFPLVNISGGVGDMYYFFRIIALSPEKRIDWTNKCDEKILKSIIWKKKI